MSLSKEEYQDYVKKMSPNSPLWKDVINAFWSGGVICVIGELILNGYGALGLSETDAGTATSISMIFLGALLTGLGLYNKIAKFAGAGTVVPITGFANSVVAPALEFKTEGFVTGTAVKMFSIAGPVIVYGTLASVVYGIILVIAQSF